MGSLLLLLAACASKGPVASVPPVPSVQEASFEAAWSTIGERYYDAEMGGVDWQQAHDELLPRARAAGTNAELRPVLEDLTQRLGESHFGVIPQEAYETFSAVALSGATPAVDPSGATGPGELGLDVRWIEDQVVITWLEAEGPAASAGVGLGWTVTRIDERGVDELVDAVRGAVTEDRQAGLYVRQAVRASLEGAEGQPVELELLDGEGEVHVLSIERGASTGELASFGQLPPTLVHLRHHIDEDGIGYIAFDIFLAQVVPRFTEAVLAMKEADVEGVILDLRGNPGGLGGMVMGMAGHFVGEPDQVLGIMRPRGEELRFIANPRPRSQRLDVPLAVLIDGQSGSTSEILAAGLQGIGRARVFGSQSAGMALPSHIELLPNGDRLQFVTADMVGPTGERIEGDGVTPDVVVPLDRASLLAGNDPVVSQAKDWLKSAE